MTDETARIQVAWTRFPPRPGCSCGSVIIPEPGAVFNHCAPVPRRTTRGVGSQVSENPTDLMIPVYI